MCWRRSATRIAGCSWPVWYGTSTGSRFLKEWVCDCTRLLVSLPMFWLSSAGGHKDRDRPERVRTERQEPAVIIKTHMGDITLEAVNGSGVLWLYSTCTAELLGVVNSHRFLSHLQLFTLTDGTLSHLLVSIMSPPSRLTNNSQLVFCLLWMVTTTQHHWVIGWVMWWEGSGPSVSVCGWKIFHIKRH